MEKGTNGRGTPSSVVFLLEINLILYVPSFCSLLMHQELIGWKPAYSASCGHLVDWQFGSNIVLLFSVSLVNMAWSTAMKKQNNTRGCRRLRNATPREGRWASSLQLPRKTSQKSQARHISAATQAYVTGNPAQVRQMIAGWEADLNQWAEQEIQEEEWRMLVLHPENTRNKLTWYKK